MIVIWILFLFIVVILASLFRNVHSLLYHNWLIIKILYSEYWCNRNITTKPWKSVRHSKLNCNTFCLKSVHAQHWGNMTGKQGHWIPLLSAITCMHWLCSVLQQKYHPVALNFSGSKLYNNHKIITLDKLLYTLFMLFIYLFIFYFSALKVFTQQKVYIIEQLN